MPLFTRINQIKKKKSQWTRTLSFQTMCLLCANLGLDSRKVKISTINSNFLLSENKSKFGGETNFPVFLKYFKKLEKI